MGDMADFYDEDPVPFDDDPPTVSCKRCGKPDLYWECVGESWRLVDDNGREHICSERDLHKRALEDFDVL